MCKLYNCLWFDKEAHEAASFYCSIFNNTHITSTNPIVTEFTIDGFKVMALNGGPKFNINPAISFFVNVNTVDEVNRLWNALLVGGEVMMPLDKYDWSPRYGWLKDKYGFTWQIAFNQNSPDPLIIKPCMLFTAGVFGQAHQAMQFYTKVFPQSQIHLHIPYQTESEFAGKTLFAEFTLRNTPIFAMDGPNQPNYTFNEGVSFVVTCDTQAEIDAIWDKLSFVPEAEQCGWLKDKFGVAWQIVPSILGKLMSDPARAPRVIAAFLKMKKFDIETLVNA